MTDSTFIRPLIFDTTDLPQKDQFEAWRSYNASVIDVSLSRQERGSFSFRQEVWDFGKVALSTSRLPGPMAPRSWEHLNKNPIDHWCLVLPESTAHAAGTASEHPQVYLRNLGTPFAGSAADSSVTSVFIPRDMMRSLAGILERHGGELSQSALGGLFADFLISLERRLPTITEIEMRQLPEVICAMVAACVAPTGDNLVVAKDAIADTLLERARLRIQKDLFSPRLNPSMLCRDLGMSRSTLYSLFEPLQGVSRYIQRQRMIAAHKMLSDPRSVLSIQQIADSLCFANTGSFSRSFRQMMGLTPSDVRNAGAMHEQLTTPSVPLPRLERLTDLGQVLRRLQA